MNSSISSFNGSKSLSTVIKLPLNTPLIQDIQAQKERFWIFIVKLSVFVILFLTFDRLAAKFLEEGLDRNFGLDEPAKILCLGNSRSALGIDKPLLEKELGFPVAKYARNGANIADRLAMMKQYVESQPSSVKILVYDVDAHIFTGKGLSLNSYTLFYPFMDSSSIDAYVHEYASFYDYGIRHLLKLRRFDLETCNLSLRGWLRKYDNLKSGSVDMERLKKEFDNGQIRHISFDEENILCFEQTLRFALEKGIYVVLLNIPTVDLYNQAEPEKYMHAIELLKGYASENDQVTFLDYTPFFCQQHELFYDPIHLNPKGQKVVTEKLVQDLKSLCIQIGCKSSD